MGGYCINNCNVGSHEVVDSCVSIPIFRDNVEYVGIVIGEYDDRVIIIKKHHDLAHLEYSDPDVFD